MQFAAYQNRIKAGTVKKSNQNALVCYDQKKIMKGSDAIIKNCFFLPRVNLNYLKVFHTTQTFTWQNLSQQDEVIIIGTDDFNRKLDNAMNVISNTF